HCVTALLSTTGQGLSALHLSVSQILLHLKCVTTEHLLFLTHDDRFNLVIVHVANLMPMFGSEHLNFAISGWRQGWHSQVSLIHILASSSGIRGLLHRRHHLSRRRLTVLRCH